MAAGGRKAEKPKRVRKRKARTEVESSSSSASSESEASEASEVETPQKRQKPDTRITPSASSKSTKREVKTAAVLPSSTAKVVAVKESSQDSSSDATDSDNDSSTPSLPATKPGPAQDKFGDFYLRTIAKELAEDIDKIRSAGDFTDASVPLLIQALRQGEGLYSQEEKRRVVGDAAVR